MSNKGADDVDSTSNSLINNHDFPATPIRGIASPLSTAKSPYVTPIPSPPNSRSNEDLDDLDIMLCHEDFPKLVSLASEVKSLRETGAVEPNIPKSNHGKDGPLEASEVISAVTRMQDHLLSASAKQHDQHDTTSVSSRFPKIARGSYPMTDSLIDDSFAILQREFDRCQRNGDSNKKARRGSSSQSKKAKEAIAIKYSKWQTDVLMQWVIEHKDNPFPDPSDVHELMQKTNLTYSQIINWTTNVRKRNRKATCEDGKKPHHFIDFLFLAHKRDTERATGQADCSDGSAATPRTSNKAVPGTLTSSARKRKADSQLQSPMRTPHRTPRHRPYHSPYTPVSPYGSEYAYGGMPFPVTPAYHYGHSPHHPPLSPSYYYAHPQGQPHGAHPTARKLQYTGAYQQHPSTNLHAEAYYQQHSPSVPTTPSRVERMTPQLSPIPEKPPTPVAQSKADAKSPSTRHVLVKKEPGTEHEPEEDEPAEDPPTSIRRIKQEPGTDRMSPSPPQVRIKQEPEDQPSSNEIKIKQEPDTVNVVAPSFDDEVQMFEPINVDDPQDNSMLQEFASYWEIKVKEESDEEDASQEQEQHSNIRPDGAVSSSLSLSDAPSLMDEAEDEQQWLVPSVSAEDHSANSHLSDHLDLDSEDLNLEIVDLADDLGVVGV
jgi:hypothetical protein